MPKQPEPLGAAQLEVLQYIAEHFPVRVSVVAEHFAKTSGKARTTILTVMDKLLQKGYLKRKKIKGTYHYSPRQSKNELLAGLVDRFIKTSLSGSISPFIAYLSESKGVTDAELESLKRLISELER